MSVAIDAMVAIWFLKQPHHKPRKATSQDVADMQRRAFVLIEGLADKKTTVIMPSVAVAEVLLGIDPKDHGQVVAEMNKVFFLASFDVSATAIAAKLWQETRGLPEHEQPTRTCLKADVMIVATAKAAGAEAVYSGEKKVRALAKRAGMEGLDLPTHSEDLFIDADSRKAAEQEPDA